MKKSVFMHVYTAAADRARHASIDTLTADAHDALDALATESRPAVDSLRFMLDRLVVANIEHGVVKVPNTFDRDESLLHAAVYCDEVVDASDVPVVPSIIQRNRMARTLKSWGLESERDLQEVVDLVTPISSVSIDNTIGGKCITPHTRISVTKDGHTFERFVMGRPWVVSRVDRDVHQSKSFLVLFHELDHSAQVEMTPFTPAKKRRAADLVLRHELEAYSLELEIALALYNSEGTVYSRDRSLINGIALEVDRIRREANEGFKDPYKPNAVILKKLAQVGLDSIVG